MKRWFLPAAARARGQSNDLNREILASNLFNCCKEVINAPPVPSISRCIHIVYRHKNVWEYQWSNFIYNCMSTFLYYVHCKDALLDCSTPGGERCESLTRVDEIVPGPIFYCCIWVNPDWVYTSVMWVFINQGILLWLYLTHWGRVTHICVRKLTIIGSDNGLSPDRRQAIIWTNAGLLLIGPSGTNFSEILIEILTFSFRKCVWKWRLQNGGHFVSASMC